MTKSKINVLSCWNETFEHWCNKKVETIGKFPWNVLIFDKTAFSQPKIVLLKIFQPVLLRIKTPSFFNVTLSLNLQCNEAVWAVQAPVSLYIWKSTSTCQFGISCVSVKGTCISVPKWLCDIQVLGQRWDFITGKLLFLQYLMICGGGGQSYYVCMKGCNTRVEGRERRIYSPPNLALSLSI